MGDLEGLILSIGIGAAIFIGLCLWAIRGEYKAFKRKHES